MNEKNYEVDENGKKIVHHPDFVFIDTETNTNTSTSTSTSTNTCTIAKKRSSSPISPATQAVRKLKCDQKKLQRKHAKMFFRELNVRFAVKP